jgi:hypothetical protein
MAYPFVEVLPELGCSARYEKLTDRIRTRPALVSAASDDFFGLRSRRPKQRNNRVEFATPKTWARIFDSAENKNLDICVDLLN